MAMWSGNLPVEIYAKIRIYKTHTETHIKVLFIRNLNCGREYIFPQKNTMALLKVVIMSG